MKRFHFHVEPVGACDLRCPACAVGNSPHAGNPKGAMSPGLLRAILEKAVGECIVDGVSLYNWAEPMLAPRLPDLVRIVRGFGIPCDLSTNLNRARRLEDVLRAGPETLRVSLSGFEQSRYGRTHAGGDIERVKVNLHHLAKLREKTGATTEVEVRFHRYRDNLIDEAPMRDLALGLGFRFLPMWALWLPLEKVLAAEGEAGYGTTDARDEAVIDSLALPMREALAAARSQPSSPCLLRSSTISIDVEGWVQLCCGVFDAQRFRIAPFLTTSLEAIQAARHAHATCDTCMRHGVHDYFTYRVQAGDDLATRNIASGGGAPPPARIIPLTSI